MGRAATCPTPGERCPRRGRVPLHLLLGVGLCDAPGMWLRFSFLWVTPPGERSAHGSDRQAARALGEEEVPPGESGCHSLAGGVRGPRGLGSASRPPAGCPARPARFACIPGLPPSPPPWPTPGGGRGRISGQSEGQLCRVQKRWGPAGVSGSSASSGRSAPPAPALVSPVLGEDLGLKGAAKGEGVGQGPCQGDTDRADAMGPAPTSLGVPSACVVAAPPARSRPQPSAPSPTAGPTAAPRMEPEAGWPCRPEA